MTHIYFIRIPANNLNGTHTLSDHSTMFVLTRLQSQSGFQLQQWVHFNGIPKQVTVTTQHFYNFVETWLYVGLILCGSRVQHETDLGWVHR